MKILVLLLLSFVSFDNDFEKCVNDNLKEQNKTISTLENLVCRDKNISSIDGIEKLKNLQSIDFSGNFIKVIPKSISSLKNLKSVNFSNNIIKDVNSLLSVSSLEFLYLANNEINTLPIGINNLSNLSVLNLSGNNLIFIPDLNLSNLEKLHLSTNRIIEVGNLNLNNLSYLDLNNNQLFSLGLNLNLDYLNLDYNLFDIDVLYGFSIKFNSFLKLIVNEVDVENSWSSIDYDLRSTTILSNGYMLQGFNSYELVDKEGRLINFDEFLKNNVVVKNGSIEGFVKVSMNGNSSSSLISKSMLKINFKKDDLYVEGLKPEELKPSVFKPKDNVFLNRNPDVVLGSDVGVEKVDASNIYVGSVWKSFLNSQYDLKDVSFIPYNFKVFGFLNVVLFFVMLIPILVFSFAGRKFFKNFQ